MPQAATLKDAAKKLRVAYSTVLRWRQLGCPGKGPRGWDLAKIKAWRKKNILPRGRPCRQSDDEDDLTDRQLLLRAQMEEKQANAELARIKAEAAKGNYMPIEEVRRRDGARIAAVRRGLLALPKAMGARVGGLAPREAEEILRSYVIDLLRRFSEM
jgi:hypothetical protein